VLAAYKWHMLLPQARFAGLLGACLASNYVALLLPGQLAQEAAKAYFLRGPEAPKMSLIATSVVIDKILSLFGLLVVGIIGIALSAQTRYTPLAWIFAGFAIVALVVFFSLLLEPPYMLMRRWLISLSRGGPRWAKAADWLLEVVDAWHMYSRDPFLIGRNVAFAIAYHLLGAASFYLLSIAMHQPIGFADWCWITGVLTIALTLPLTIGGLGIREGTLIGILGTFGYSTEDAIAVSLVAFAFVLMLAVLGAVIVHFPRSPEHPGSNRRI
jgi:glycosyltransferase 2 family protein